ncbi:MAG TPA: KpsF/GutQ family sugar-phosphate isomerase, partial [Phycisphaerales bacterium]|nr:KpsF/GutQ family sugar-phosphate isomerase [Phycisphaerales bacterium]
MTTRTSTQPDPQSSSARCQEHAFITGVLRAEAAAIGSLVDRAQAWGDSLHRAVDLIVRCADAGGSVLVAGIGKSGIIGRKISATLASLGVPSHDIHPTEAAHGDLGRIRSTDLLITLSNSGETEEVLALAEALRQDGVSVLAITGGQGASTLARISTICLSLGDIGEAGDRSLAPTCSTTAMLAVGDALALAAARRRAFTDDDFARRHPGGTLGGLMRPVTDALRFVAGRNLPVFPERLTVRKALEDAAKLGRRPGAILITDAAGVLIGIFTDGDLRRLILRDAAELDQPISAVMTRAPRTISASATVRDAVHFFRENR